MGLLLINIGLIIGVIAALLVLTVGLRRWREQRAHAIEQRTLRDQQNYDDWIAQLEVQAAFLQSLPSKRLEPRTASWRHAELRELFDMSGDIVYHKLIAQHERNAKLLSLSRFVLLLNLVTTVIALIPIGFAVYSLITNNQLQALNFNIAALAMLVVTKGGVLLLTLVIKPAIIGASGYAGTQVAKKVWEKQRQQTPEH